MFELTNILLKSTKNWKFPIVILTSEFEKGKMIP